MNTSSITKETIIKALITGHSFAPKTNSTYTHTCIGVSCKNCVFEYNSTACPDKISADLIKEVQRLHPELFL